MFPGEQACSNQPFSLSLSPLSCLLLSAVMLYYERRQQREKYEIDLFASVFFGMESSPTLSLLFLSLFLWKLKPISGQSTCSGECRASEE